MLTKNSILYIKLFSIFCPE